MKLPARLLQPRLQRLQLSLRACLAILAVAPGVAAQGPTVVINEVHYHPADDSPDGEFVELYNHGQDTADLTDWVLARGVELLFPAGTMLPPDGYLLVAADPAALAARHALPPGAVIAGAFNGNLSNGGERLELYTGGGYLASFIEYGDRDPWPESPDGLGPSLERLSSLREEDDAHAWAASLVIGGTPGARNSVFVPDPPPNTSGQALIPTGAIWRYFKGVTEPPAAWRDRAFDDRAWDSGQAGFGVLDDDDTTLLPDMRFNYSTLYIRHAFQVAAPEAVRTLRLTVLYDDGYIAYLNGVEVDRANVPGSPGQTLPRTAVAASNVEPPLTRTFDLAGHRDLLVAGTNVLAVQGFNSAIDNRDFSLHPSLEGDTGGGQEAATLIAAGAEWRFFRGQSAPPAAWRDLSFSETGWESGPAGFGFGDGDDATQLLDMQGSYLTVFIRRRFLVEDPASIASLTLSVDYDDGFIAYLNGAEVAGANVTAAGFDAPADNDHEAGVPETFSIAAALQPGENILAIEGHNFSLASTDFSLSPVLEATLVSDDDPPGGPGPVPAPRDVALNEVLPAAPGGGWVELLSLSAATVNLAGRRLASAAPGGGAHTFPAGATIAPGARLLLPESQLGFSLAAAPVLALTTADGRTIDLLALGPPAAGLACGRWPDGDSNRIVFTAPTPDAANAFAAEARVVINEIQFHPADGNTGGEFIELHNRSAEPVDVSRWSFTRGIEFTLPAGTTIAASGYLVVARDPAAAAARHGIPTPLGPYPGRLRNDAETLLLRDALGNPVDRVRYADEGSWPDEEADGLGPSLELVNPALENRYGPAWAASSGEGTPGARNSRFAADPPPLVAGVEHAPAVPGPADAVLVTAACSDERPLSGVTLFWQLDGGGGESQLPMTDDGTGDDGIAGNGVYGARIPPQAARAIVLFWIRASAAGGQGVTVPAGAPDPAFLYQVESAAAEGVRPLYRVVMRAADLNALRTRGVDSDVLLDCTFIAAGRARYNRGIRYRGSSARRCNPLSYRVQFDHDVDFEGIKRLNLNGCSTHRQWIGLDFLSRTGVPSPQTWFRAVSFNGAVQNDIFLRVEAIDDQFLERHLPDDDGGNLYRGVSNADLDYRGEDFGDYDGDYIRETNEEVADGSDIIELCSRFDAGSTPAAEFPAAIEAVIDVQEWALYFAAYAFLASTENSIVLDNGDDYYLYNRPSDGRWILLPWDLDSCFDEADQVLFRPTVDQIERFLEHPRYAPEYWCQLEALRAGAFEGDLVASRLARLAPLFISSRITTLAAFHPARRAYVDPRLSSALTIEVTAGGRICGDSLEPGQDPMSLSGEAPGCGTAAVRVNGVPAAFNQLTSDWQATVNLDGAENLRVEALDVDGRLVASRELTVVPAASYSPLPSTITGTTTLTAAASPYRAAADVTVAAGGRLVVEPGVEIVLDGDASLIVDGVLEAVGTAAAPVRFASDPCAGSWEGIVFRGGGRSSRLARCELQGLTAAQGFAAALAVTGGHELVLEDAVIRGPAGGTALEARGGGSRARLARSLFRGAAVAASIVDGGRVEADHLTVVEGGRGFVLAEATPGGGSGTLAGHSLLVWVAGAALEGAAGGNAAVTFSDLAGAGVFPGTGNINADPRFLDAPAGDFRLSFASPCRATGQSGTDMGAYPYESTGEMARFLLCDSNGDGTNNISDAVFTLSFLFNNGRAAPCAAALDCNLDATVNLTDAIFNLNFLFLSGPMPAPPYPACSEAPIAGCLTTTCAF